MANADQDRRERDTGLELDRRRREERDWSPTSRSQYRARDMYQDTRETRGFYEQPRERRLGGAMKSEEEFYARGRIADDAERPGADSSAGHRGKGPKGYTRSDERIREDVSDRLFDDRRLDASDMEVEVKDGEVTLSGEVADRESKRRAEDIAESCSGVRDVQNRLRVQ